MELKKKNNPFLPPALDPKDQSVKENTATGTQLDIFNNKVVYYRDNKKMNFPSIRSMKSNVSQFRYKENGEPLTLDDRQHKLLVTLHNILETEGISVHTLDEIIRKDNGSTPTNEHINITAARRRAYKALLESLMCLVVLPTQNGDKVGPFVDMVYIENYEINGTKTNVYLIKGININIHCTQTIQYWRMALPAGYAPSPENIHIQLYIFDKLGRDITQLDFEELCSELYIPRDNRKKRHDLREKIITMVRFYGFDGVTLKSQRKSEYIEKIELDKPALQVNS